LTRCVKKEKGKGQRTYKSLRARPINPVKHKSHVRPHYRVLTHGLNVIRLFIAIIYDCS
jgi:hypothetical protein